MKHNYKDSETDCGTSESDNSSSYIRMSLNEAMELIKEKRPMVNPNKQFMKQLKEFEEELNDEQPLFDHKERSFKSRSLTRRSLQMFDS